MRFGRRLSRRYRKENPVVEAKYDLKQMLREIKEDEKVAPQTVKRISQKEIRDRVLRKRKEMQDGR